MAVAIQLTGCSTRGAPFVKPDRPNPETAQVYLYRTQEPPGDIPLLPIIGNGTELAQLQRGEFFAYGAIPGLHEFHTDTSLLDKKLALQLQAGQIYYLRATVRHGMWTSTWSLESIAPAHAVAELQSCCHSASR